MLSISNKAARLHLNKLVDRLLLTKQGKMKGEVD